MRSQALQAIEQGVEHGGWIKFRGPGLGCLQAVFDRCGDAGEARVLEKQGARAGSADVDGGDQQRGLGIGRLLQQFGEPHRTRSTCDHVQHIQRFANRSIALFRTHDPSFRHPVDRLIDYPHSFQYSKLSFT